VGEENIKVELEIIKLLIVSFGWIWVWKGPLESNYRFCFLHP